jgi:fatty-acyl-CoA synthase
MEFSVADSSHEAIAATRPDAECLVFRDHRFTWRDVTERTRRLANHLIGRGLGCAASNVRSCPVTRAGQDHLAIYLHNGNEYLEAMLGAFKARVAPFNVNYRYVAEELRYLLTDSGRRRSWFTASSRRRWPTSSRDLPRLTVILQVPDESGNELLPGAVWYEDALAAAVARPAAVDVESRRSVHPLHRRNDRACRRACCGATATPTSSASADRRHRPSKGCSPRPTAV